MSDRPQRPEDIEPGRDIARLVAIMAALRTPVTGCPWDLEQSFGTIAPYTIEEAYEVADAIQRGDRADLCDELGDLLLQVVYHSRLAEEEGAFAFPDVVEAITSKMIRRHPHVFGDAEARAAGAAKDFWEQAKAAERAAKARARAKMAELLGGSRGVAGDATYRATLEPAAPGLLEDVPVGLPGLTRAVKLQDKAAGVGFDWPDLAPVFDKMREELVEFAEVALPHDPRGDTGQPASAAPPALRERIEEEYGDLLFVMANVARHLKLDPEAALRAANAKFMRRFRAIEAGLAARGKTPAQSDLAEMDALWNDAKAAEKA